MSSWIWLTSPNGVDRVFIQVAQIGTITRLNPPVSGAQSEIQVGGAPLRVHEGVFTIFERIGTPVPDV